MKTKKRTRLISLFLAVVMAVSALTASLSAQAAYKPTYGEKATEEDFALMIEDINTILDDLILTGDTIESIYKMLPALGSILNGGYSDGGTAGINYYIRYDADRWGALADFVDEGTTAIVDDSTDDEGNVIPGTFSKFFEENPIVCETQADFQTELNYMIDMIIDANLLSTITFAFVFGGDITAAQALATGIDEVCEALGIEQEVSAVTALGFDDYSGDEAATETYLKNIVAGILPDAANSVLDIVRTVCNDDKAALLYSGVSKVLDNLSSVLNSLSGSLSSLMDLSAVVEVIAQINDVWDSIPTTGEGEATRIDENQLISFVCNQAGLGIVTSLIRFPDMNLDNITGTETNADLVKTVYDYIYNTLIGNEANNATLKSVINDPTGQGSILEGALGTELPTELEDALLAILDMSSDDIANELIVGVAALAGREIEDPTEDPTEDPSNDPTEEDPTEEPSNQPTDPTEDSAKDDATTTTAAGSKLPNANTSNPNLPNTGRTYDALTAVSMIICLSAAAALVIVLISSKKKVTE